MARADGLRPQAGRTRRGSGLLLCGLLSAAGHAALLLGAAPSAGIDAVGHARRVDPRPAAIELRPAPDATPFTPPSVSATPLAAAPAGARDAMGSEWPETQPPERPLEAEAAAVPVADPDDRYLPRSALDQGPAPTVAIDLPYPADAPAGRFVGVLTLFIDAEGRVRRVRHDSGTLPAQLADEARQAFLAARFSPGVKDGQAVDSRLRVAVTFGVDAPRIDPAQPAASDPN